MDKHPAIANISKGVQNTFRLLDFVIVDLQLSPEKEVLVLVDLTHGSHEKDWEKSWERTRGYPSFMSYSMVPLFKFYFEIWNAILQKFTRDGETFIYNISAVGGTGFLPDKRVATLKNSKNFLKIHFFLDSPASCPFNVMQQTISATKGSND